MRLLLVTQRYFAHRLLLTHFQSQSLHCQPLLLEQLLQHAPVSLCLAQLLPDALPGGMQPMRSVSQEVMDMLPQALPTQKCCTRQPCYVKGQSGRTMHVLPQVLSAHPADCPRQTGKLRAARPMSSV